MKKLLLLTLLILGIGLSSNLVAQKYSSAIGLRFGYPNSVSYKMFLSEKAAVEAYGSFVFSSSFTTIGVNAAYLLHNDFANAEGLSWYYGGGASVYLNSYKTGFAGDGGNIGFGVSGYLGLDYMFGNLPLNITVDFVPTFVIGGGFIGRQGALGIRYILGE